MYGIYLRRKLFGYSRILNLTRPLLVSIIRRWLVLCQLRMREKLIKVFSMRFLYSNSSGSKEASTQAQASAGQNGGTTSGQEAVIAGSTLSTRKPTPHDRYTDLQKLLISDEYLHVIVDNDPDVTVDNPTLAEVLHRQIGWVMFSS